MIPSHGSKNYTYKVLITEAENVSLVKEMRAERILWPLFPEIDPEEWPDERYVQSLMDPSRLVLGGYVDGEIAGFLTLTPFRYRGRSAELGLLAFRKFFKDALPLTTGAFDWVFQTQDCDALLGFIPVASRQSMRLFSSLGFVSMGRIPNASWFAKKKKFVDNEIVMLTREAFYAQPQYECSGS